VELTLVVFQFRIRPTTRKGSELARKRPAETAAASEIPSLATLRLWCGSFLLTVAAIAVSVWYLDRPVSRLAEKVFGHYEFARHFTDAPGFFDPLALFLFGVFLLRRLTRQRFGKSDLACLLGDASVVLSNYATSALKYVFGRTWPKYGHPSFIRQNVYGFNPFHPGGAYRSFPSGHVAALCAVLFVLWIFYPRFRAIYAIITIGFSAALIAMNYHFLSDAIGGGLVGASSAAICDLAWLRLARWRRRYLS
jgi:membrane-associated phospholipid phosphatase